jgi:hypothetical protein
LLIFCVINILNGKFNFDTNIIDKDHKSSTGGEQQHLHRSSCTIFFYFCNIIREVTTKIIVNEDNFNIQDINLYTVIYQMVTSPTTVNADPVGRTLSVFLTPNIYNSLLVVNKQIRNTMNIKGKKSIK